MEEIPVIINIYEEKSRGQYKTMLLINTTFIIIIIIINNVCAHWSVPPLHISLVLILLSRPICLPTFFLPSGLYLYKILVIRGVN
jgi:hypothetical protein